MTESDTAYEVHLTDAVAEQLEVDSPVTTDHVDFYDSGLWVGTRDGRDFYPYEHVLTVRERSTRTRRAGRETPATVEGESTG